LTTLFPSPIDTQIYFTATIKLAVTAPEDLAKEIENVMAQALDAVPNVQLVTEAADWTLVILSVAVQVPSRAPHGVALSVIVVETPARQLQERAHMQPALVAAGSSERLSIFHGAWLRVAARSQLPRLCQQVVADFNSRYLAERRRARQ
jgi:hypothetical protein